MQKFFKQKNTGFTLIETLVAISIFTLSILGLISILASGISNTNYAKQKVTATYLAQEGIEYARNLRDNAVLSGAGWSSFNSNGTIEDNIVIGNFNRTTTKEFINGDEARITSAVTVSQASGAYTITLSEDLFNWVE